MVVAVNKCCVPDKLSPTDICDVETKFLYITLMNFGRQKEWQIILVAKSY